MFRVGLCESHRTGKNLILLVQISIFVQIGNISGKLQTMVCIPRPLLKLNPITPAGAQPDAARCPQIGMCESHAKRTFYYDTIAGASTSIHVQDSEHEGQNAK